MLDLFFRSLIKCFIYSVGRLLGRYCGTTVPRAVDTSDSFAYVLFVSNSRTVATGFRINFVASVEGKISTNIIGHNKCNYYHSLLTCDLCTLIES